MTNTQFLVLNCIAMAICLLIVFNALQQTQAKLTKCEDQSLSALEE